MQMTRTAAQIEQALRESEELFDSLPDGAATDASDLTAIGAAVHDRTTADAAVAERVAAARANGRSWGAIGAYLGVSRQAARERYMEHAEAK